MDRSRRRRIAALAIALTGLIVVGVGIYELVGNLGHEWETVRGTVVAAEVVREDRPMARKGRDRVTWQPEITYEYSVIGRTYTSDALHAGVPDATRFPIEDLARDYLADYPVGSRVEVYYDPDDPEVSALEVDAGAGWILVGIGALLLGWSGVLVVRARS